MLAARVWGTDDLYRWYKSLTIPCTTGDIVRRDAINEAIAELGRLVPYQGNTKRAILEMAVAYINQLQASNAELTAELELAKKA